ncbi:hypothetical protein Scep_010207 [Stephania cephalantha]|uniref:Zinc-finger domain-containing protein n=1 Tax=Stephania cephalantha TaxID=152367 RepID=A0AAP0JUK5_9MAGN
MVTLRKRVRTVESTAANEKPIIDNTTDGTDVSDGRSVAAGYYEQCRVKRIKENMERMQELGIRDRSVKLKSDLLVAHNKRNHTKPPKSSSSPPFPLLSSQPPRRSSRLQNATSVNYSDKPAKKENTEADVDAMVGEGLNPEIYTEEQEKLLGSCEESWTLFVDGCGSDGKRIYDSVKGKTCHQCRYGENVLEANKNPDWICPVCRGICNCSLCRQAKGWPPTGSLYRKISRLGFKSVAHYLIQTRRPQTNSKNTCIDDAVSARRSLPFAESGEETECKDCASADNTLCEAPKTEFEDGENNDEIKRVEDESLNMESDPNIDAEENSECKGYLVDDNRQPEALETGFENGKSNHETNGEEDEYLYLDSKLGINDAVVERGSNANAEENFECKDYPIADSSQDKASKTEIEYGKSNDEMKGGEDESLNLDSKHDISNAVVQGRPNIDGHKVRATESISESLAGILKRRHRRS